MFRTAERQIAAPVTRPWGMTIAGLALIAVGYGLARFAYGLFVPAFRATFSLSEALLGVIAGGSYVGYVVAAVLSAAAVARAGPRAVAIGGGIIAASGMTVVALAPNGIVLAAGVLIAGTSTGVVSPPLAEAIARWLPEGAQDRSQAIVNTGTGAGIAASVPVALLALGQWRAAWLGFAVIAVLVTLWIRVVIPRSAAPAAADSAASGPSRSLRGLLTVARDPRSRPLIIGAGLFGAASSAVWMFGRDHVMTAGGMSEQSSMLLWGALGAAQLIGLAAGGLAARHGLRRLWIIAITAMVMATLLLALFPGPPAFAAIAVFGAAYLVLTTIVLLWGVRLHPEHTAAAVAVGFLMIALGQAAGSPLFGLVGEVSDTRTALIASVPLGLATMIIGTVPAGDRQ